MTPEPDSLAITVVRLDERTATTARDVTDIKLNMATKSDQAHTDAAIREVVGALAQEKAAREAAIAVEKNEREQSVSKVSDRLQLVEDRQESRKYNVQIAIILAVVSNIVAVVLSFLKPGG